MGSVLLMDSFQLRIFRDLMIQAVHTMTLHKGLREGLGSTRPCRRWDPLWLFFPGKAFGRVLHPLKWGTAQSPPQRTAQGQLFLLLFFSHWSSWHFWALLIKHCGILGGIGGEKKGQLWVFKEQVFRWLAMFSLLLARTSQLP